MDNNQLEQLSSETEIPVNPQVVTDQPTITVEVPTSDNIANPQDIPQPATPQCSKCNDSGIVQIETVQDGGITLVATVCDHIEMNRPQGSGQQPAEIVEALQPVPEEKPERNERGQFLPGNQESEGLENSGRPCGFCEKKEEIMHATQEYIDKAMKARNEQKPFMPFVEDLALLLGKSEQTILNWANKETADSKIEHPEFLDLITKLKTCQKLLLLRRTLGRYNPHGAEFQLSRAHGMIETTKQVHTGVKDEPITYRVVEDKKIADE